MLQEYQLIKAHTFWSRYWGLMFKNEFPSNCVLEIMPCSSIHTFFMKFPINVLFVDKKNCIVDYKINVKPWRLLFSKSFRTCKTLEMTYKGNENLQVERGQKIVLIHDEKCEKILL